MTIIVSVSFVTFPSDQTLPLDKLGVNSAQGKLIPKRLQARAHAKLEYDYALQRYELISEFTYWQWQKTRNSSKTPHNLPSVKVCSGRHNRQEESRVMEFCLNGSAGRPVETHEFMLKRNSSLSLVFSRRDLTSFMASMDVMSARNLRRIHMRSSVILS